MTDIQKALSKAVKFVADTSSSAKSNFKKVGNAPEIRTIIITKVSR